MGSLAQAALGFRAHSGWAVAVAIGGTPADPRVLLRQRIVLSRRTPRQPFHAAEGKPFAQAQDLVARATREATSLASTAVREIVAEVKKTGHEATAAALLAAASRPLPDLRAILASHALIHAAEGGMFRDVLRTAAHEHRLRLTEVKERDLDEAVQRALRRTDAELKARLTAWGKALGPPWTQDEKRAALIAWMALTS